jgi:hypothetical protein
MTQPDWNIERADVERVANDLRQKGYNVVTEPSVSELPDFLREYRPDIIANGKDESLVVQVNDLLSSTEQERVRAIARRVENRPGWRFLLVSPHPYRSAVFQEDEPLLEPAGVRDLLSEARAVAEHGLGRAALVMAWAGLEAAMRVAAQRHEISVERSDSWTLMRELVSEGVLGRDSYQHLTELFRLRSAFAHGMQPVDLPAGINLEEAAASLITVAEDLMKETPGGPGEAPG